MQALYTKRGLGLIIAVLTVSADQLSKYVILSITPSLPIEITSYFKLVLVFNRGISFGLFSNNRLEMFPWIMAGLAIVISVIAIIWILKTHRLLIMIGLGFVIGGALGNGIDRLYIGAVVDFLDFHIEEWHWPAFNLADSGLCIGAFFLLLDAFYHR